MTFTLEQKDDPILWGTYLLYSGYSKKYEAEILERISKLLSEKIDAIVNVDSAYLYRELWWILIFNKCPFISSNDQRRIDALINSLTSKGKDKSGKIIGDLFIEYLKTSQDQFFIWDMNKDFLRNLTFKTRQRTIFKNYQNGLLSLYWSSL